MQEGGNMSQNHESKTEEAEWRSHARTGIISDRQDTEDREEALGTTGELSFHQDVSVKQREYSGGSSRSTDSARTTTSRQSADSYGTVEATSTAVSGLSQSTSGSSWASTASTLFDLSQKDAVKHMQPIPILNHTLPEYEPHDCDPDGPRYCKSTEFRMFDPFCPQRYRCTGYDLDAVWFDGRNKGDLRYTIDLENGTMDRLPDIRPYLYYMGYWSHWEIEDATAPSGLDGLTRAETEDFYIKQGRVYLMNERKQGRGYFLGNRDWSGLVEEWGALAWRAFWFTDATDQDVGMDDYHSGDMARDHVGKQVLKTNIRASLSYQRQVKVRPGDDDWDAYIQWLYGQLKHGLEQITQQHNTVEDVFQFRFTGTASKRFMIREEIGYRQRYH